MTTIANIDVNNRDDGVINNGFELVDFAPAIRGSEKQVAWGLKIIRENYMVLAKEIIASLKATGKIANVRMWTKEEAALVIDTINNAFATADKIVQKNNNAGWWIENARTFPGAHSFEAASKLTA